jgi:hypothetical protein
MLDIDTKLAEIKTKSYNGLFENFIKQPSNAGSILEDITEILQRNFPTPTKEFEDIGFEFAKPTQINFSNLLSLQDVLSYSNFERLVRIIQKGQLRTSTSGEDAVYVIQYHNQKYIIDGNHRIAAMILFGKTNVSGKLLDLDHLPDNSPDRLIAEFKKLGVVISFSDHPRNGEFLKNDCSIKILDIILGVFKKAKQKNLKLPPEIKVDNSMELYAYYDHIDHFMGINTGLFLNPTITHSYVIDNNKEALIWHELGHIYHEKTQSKTFSKETSFSLKLKRDIEDKVSEYAAVNSTEFVAEVFCGKIFHKSFEKWILDLYNYILDPKTEVLGSQFEFNKKTHLISLRLPVSPTAKLSSATIKQIITKLGYKDVLNEPLIGIPKAFYIMVKNKKEIINFVKPIFDALRIYNPKMKELEHEGPYLPEYRYIEVGDFKIFARIKDTIKLPTMSAGRKNELDFYNAIHEYLEVYKNINIEFQVNGRTDFFVKNITDIIDVSTKKTKERLKSNMNLVTYRGIVPISIKQADAPGWESPETYWGEITQHVFEYVLDTYPKLVKLKNKNGIYNLDPEIDIQTSSQEAQDVIFGDDIYKHGAVIKQTWETRYFDWDYRFNTLILECKTIIQNLNDVPFEDYPFFQIRNFENKNPKYLLKGLGVLAVTKKTIAKRHILLENQEAQTAKQYVSPNYTLENIRKAT